MEQQADIDNQPLISYKKVSINQQALCVLTDIDFELNKGDFVYLIGKVGSGKSTFLKTIYAELDINSGEANVLGYNLLTMKRKNVAALRRKLGIVFQDFQLLTDRTVYENLNFVLRATGWKNKTEIENRIKEVLTLVGMENKGYKMPNELSGGEQQRIVIARAILNKPEVILADEPTGNLDPAISLGIMKLLDRINRAGTTVVMATHDREMVDSMRKRVIALEAGHVVRDQEKGGYGYYGAL